MLTLINIISGLVRSEFRIALKVVDLCFNLNPRDAQRDLCIQSNRRDTLRRFYGDQRRQMEAFDKKETQFWQDEEAIVYFLSETVTKVWPLSEFPYKFAQAP